jgi:hypothetical protein
VITKAGTDRSKSSGGCEIPDLLDAEGTLRKSRRLCLDFRQFWALSMLAFALTAVIMPQTMRRDATHWPTPRAP